MDLAHAGSPRTQLAKEAAAANSDVDAELWEVLSAKRQPAHQRMRNCLQRAPVARVCRHAEATCATAASDHRHDVRHLVQVLDICEDAELEEIHNILYGACLAFNIRGLTETQDACVLLLITDHRAEMLSTCR